VERFRRSAAALLLAAHGISHVVGIELLWKLDQPGLLRYEATVPAAGTFAGYAAGSLWLIAMALFLVSAWAVLRSRRWWITATFAVAVSLPNLLLNPQVGWVGVIFDGLVLGAVLLTVLRPPDDETIIAPRGRARVRGWLHRG